jgi:hypothetical protein
MTCTPAADFLNALRAISGQPRFLFEQGAAMGICAIVDPVNALPP